ncbi:O-antigen ligase family protein [Parvibaculum sp.]|uniref:O-antigen ligase family protein n=1 Tax=Parvibaculum sp. TaxID=2024848 RepID=UPI0032EDE75C
MLSAASSHAPRWIFWGVLAIIALAPLPLGSNRPLPSALLLVATGLLLVAWSAYAAHAKGAITLRKSQLLQLTAPALLYGLVLVWIFLQWMPLAGMVHSWADPLWEEAARAIAMPLRPSVSINPAATLDGALRLMAYAGLFWLTLHLARDPTRAAQARAAIIIVGAATSLYGLFAFFGGQDWLLGNIGARPADSLTSSFVNRNSFATFAGLTLLAAVSLFLERIRHLLALERPFRRKLVLVIEHMVFQSGLLTGAVLTIALALFLTTSRGGIFASLFALGALVLLQLPGRGGSQKRSIGFVVLVVLGIAIVAGGGNFLDRLERQGLSFETNLRSTLFATTIDAIRTAPLTGTGFGTYGQAIEAYRVSDENIFAIWEKAHNTYLENALELGLPAAIALNLAIFLLARRAFLGVRARKRHKSFPALGVASTLLVGLHALVDFSLQIPAVAVLYAFIMGLALAQSSLGGRSASSTET